MNTRLTVTVSLLAGLLGGLVTRYVTPSVVLAQDKAPITREVRAQSFTLVDSSDHAIGTFAAEPLAGTVTVLVDPDSPSNGQSAPRMVRPQMRIVLRDSNGREMWSAGSGVRMLPALIGSTK